MEVEFSKNIDPRITNILIDWIVTRSDMRFFSSIALQTEIVESTNLPTMGVWISRNGFNLAYNKSFLDKLSDSELCFVLIHEFMHLISYHCNRTREFNLHPRLANIAQDCIINTEILETYGGKYTMPEGGWVIPKDFKELKISELVYLYLQSDEFKENDPDNYAKCQDAMSSPEQIDCSDLSEEELGELIDSLIRNGQIDVHLDNEVSEEVARDIAKNIYNSLKIRGLAPGSVERFIERITPRETNILSLIKKAINELQGSSRYETFSRPHRRDIDGKKGHKRQGVGANVVLDVSGSMMGLIEFVLGYVLHDNILLNVVQVDAQIQKAEVFKSKSDLQKIQIRGFGGTILQPGIDYINNNERINKLNTVILTDGYCDDLDLSKCSGRVVIVSVGREVKYSGGKWIKQVCIPKSEIDRIGRLNRI